MSLLISLGTFGLGAFLRAEPLISEDEPDRATTWAAAVIAGIIILANVGFLLGTAIYVRNEMLSMMKDTVSDIRGVLGCICRCCRGCRNKDAQEEGCVLLGLCVVAGGGTANTLTTRPFPQVQARWQPA